MAFSWEVGNAPSSRSIQSAADPEGSINNPVAATIFQEIHPSSDSNGADSRTRRATSIPRSLISPSNSSPSSLSPIRPDMSGQRYEKLIKYIISKLQTANPNYEVIYEALAQIDFKKINLRPFCVLLYLFYSNNKIKFDDVIKIFRQLGKSFCKDPSFDYALRSVGTQRGLLDFVCSHHFQDTTEYEKEWNIFDYYLKDKRLLLSPYDVSNLAKLKIKESLHSILLKRYPHHFYTHATHYLKKFLEKKQQNLATIFLNLIFSENGYKYLNVSTLNLSFEELKSNETLNFAVNCSDSEGNTLLHLSAKYQHFNITEFLLRNGADINAKNSDGNTPTHLAYLHQNIKAIEILYTYGADFTILNNDNKLPFILVSDNEFLKELYQLPCFDEDECASILADLCNSTELSSFENENLAFKVMQLLLEDYWHEGTFDDEFYRKLSTHSFVISPDRYSDDPRNYTFFTGTLEKTISKRDFFNAYTTTEYQHELINKVLNQCIKYYSPEPYRITIDRQEIVNDPLAIFKSLYNELSYDFRESINVTFERETGIDSGGLSRQLMHQLVLELARKLDFNQINSLFKPRLKTNKEGNYLPLSFDEKNIYIKMGHLLMFCIKRTCNGNRPLPIGQIFDLSFFGLFDIPHNYIRESLQWSSDKVVDTMFALLKNSHQHDIDATEHYTRLEKCFETDVSPHYLLSICESLELGEAEPTLLQQKLRRYMVEEILKPHFEPLLYIARGMIQRCNLELLDSFFDLRDMSLEARSHLTQGVLSKDTLIDSIDYSPALSPLNTSLIKTWLESWIHAASEEQLKSLLFAATGSSMLASSVKLKVTSGESVSFNTCYNQININPELLQRADFTEMFNLILESFQKNGAHTLS